MLYYPHLIIRFDTSFAAIFVEKKGGKFFYKSALKKLRNKLETKLYVGNMSYRTTEDELRTLFSEVGTVTDLVIIMDKFSGRPKGFGFVTMSSEEEAQAAIEKYDGKEVGGRQLKVNKARPREDRGGNRGGGYNNNRGGNRRY